MPSTTRTLLGFHLYLTFNFTDAKASIAQMMMFYFFKTALLLSMSDATLNQ